MTEKAAMENSGEPTDAGREWKWSGGLVTVSLSCIKTVEMVR